MGPLVGPLVGLSGPPGGPPGIEWAPWWAPWYSKCYIGSNPNHLTNACPQKGKHKQNALKSLLLTAVSWLYTSHLLLSSNHKELRLMHDKCIDKDQICSSCIQTCFFAHECNPHDINVTQHVSHVRHKIASTHFLHCIQKVHKPHKFSAMYTEGA